MFKIRDTEIQERQRLIDLKVESEKEKAEKKVKYELKKEFAVELKASLSLIYECCGNQLFFYHDEKVEHVTFSQKVHENDINKIKFSKFFKFNWEYCDSHPKINSWKELEPPYKDNGVLYIRVELKRSDKDLQKKLDSILDLMKVSGYRLKL